MPRLVFLGHVDQLPSHRKLKPKPHQRCRNFNLSKLLKGESVGHKRNIYVIKSKMKLICDSSVSYKVILYRLNKPKKNIFSVNLRYGVIRAF